MILAVSMHIKSAYKNSNIPMKSTRIYIPSNLIHMKYLKSLQRIEYEWFKITQLDTITGFVYKNKMHVLRIFI